MDYANDDFTYTTNDGLKVIFVGESSTGKTALINYLSNECFQQDIVTTSVPVESRITMKIDSKDTELTLSLWDTAGQEKFRCLNKLFFKEAKIAVIVCDITNKQSFEEIRSFWYNYIQEVCGQDIFVNIIRNSVGVGMGVVSAGIPHGDAEVDLVRIQLEFRMGDSVTRHAMEGTAITVHHYGNGG